MAGFRVGAALAMVWPSRLLTRDLSTRARNLLDVAGVARGDVDELSQIQPLDPDAYLIVDGQLDLVPLVRERVLIELALERQCHAVAEVRIVWKLNRLQARQAR